MAATRPVVAARESKPAKPSVLGVKDSRPRANTAGPSIYFIKLNAIVQYMLSIYIIKSDEVKDEAVLKSVKSTVRRHATRAMKSLNISKPVCITVYFNAAWTIQSTGETGYTPTGDWIQITLDVTAKKFPVSTVIEKRLPATIYHEMCHIKRWHTTGFGSKFPEELVSEGLACAYEMEQFNHDIKPLFIASSSEIDKLLEIVASNSDRIKNHYSYYDWFTTGDKDIPRWLGYKLGYYIVSEALNNNPSLRVNDLMSLPAKQVIKMARVKL